MFGMMPAALAMIFRATQVKTMCSTASSMLASAGRTGVARNSAARLTF